MESMKFEKSMEKLEKIVAELEAGELSLDDALAKYEEGINLAKLCSKRLNEVQKKVEVLMKKADDTFEAAPFQEESDEAKDSKKSKTYMGFIRKILRA